jgi:hypothetical protein
MTTPEGKVKDKVRRVLKRYGDEIYAFWPVKTMYGSKTLDVLLCYRGRFFSIETKAPGEDLTPLQKATRRQIQASGAPVFKIDGDTTELEQWLEQVKNAPSPD